MAITITIKNLIGGSINIVTQPEKYMGPLCFTAQEDNATVRMVGPNGGSITASLQISKDEQNTWATWDGSVVTLNKDEKLYVKALNPNTNGFYDNDSSHRFVINGGKVAASGNIQYLLDPTGERTDVPSDCYDSMFQNCTSLTKAPELPATTLANYCYYGMFLGCSSLTTAPELPATTLNQGCYMSMFNDCTSLIASPQLPATTLHRSCYYEMFKGCTSLTKAPELPATTLISNCYNSMFQNCTSLTKAPELPATTLGTDCYYNMFDGCTNITSVTMNNAVNPYNSSKYGTLGTNITINYV